ncbi:hypothetical protein MHTCC0001_20890 [Flavobacteriaceae bacterium MHTCC 0001]
MNDKKYQYILYVIIAVITATISIQTHWNYKNYLSNKQQLVTDVQTSLDKAVDDYYSVLAQKSTLGLNYDTENKKHIFKEDSITKNVVKPLNNLSKTLASPTAPDTVALNSIKEITVIRRLNVDSLNYNTQKDKILFQQDTKPTSLHVVKGDTIYFNNLIANLTTKVIISIKSDTLDIKKVDSLFRTDLKSKTIDLTYNLNYNKPKGRVPDFFNSKEIPKRKEVDTVQDIKSLSVASKSTFLPKGSALTVYFQNANRIAFKRGISAILISMLLILAVISCLFFLLKIIKEQKQLAEVKSDLINNITHEFKTPIATIGVALESITNFNVIEDKEKTKNYVNMSSNQLSKLNLMVEKLLETATLDNRSLKFNKEDVNVSHLLDNLINRYKTQHQDKTFNINIENDNIIISADPFHFENALNNILDNAIKYGGDVISTAIKKVKNNIEISFSDNGTSLKKENASRIFEKFYRVPKGNTHDVKGYGIGLYYTKTITNKHNGTIALDLSDNLTTFKITIPNDG